MSNQAPTLFKKVKLLPRTYNSIKYLAVIHNKHLAEIVDLSVKHFKKTFHNRVSWELDITEYNKLRL